MTIPINFNEKKETCKTENLYFLLIFLLITISILIIVSSHCCFIKHRLKQKHLLPYYNTHNELKEVDI